METNIKVINQNKILLRKKMLELRNQLQPQEIGIKSNQIATSIFHALEYKQATQILLFLTFGSEVDTTPIFKKAIADGKKVYVPKIMDVENCIMNFYRIENLNQLILNRFGIKEPDEKNDNLYTEQKKTLCITPGVVFDKHRHRIGYGKGFYDSFFKISSCDSIAICFDFQIMNRIPSNSMDVMVDKIISERRII